VDSKVLIQPLVLPPDEFPPLPLDPGFSQMVQDDLGNVVTAADGFDALVAEVLGIVDAIDSGLDALGGGLLDAFAEADLIDAAPVGDTVAGFTASLAPTSSAVDDLGTLLTTATTPAPTSGGGGGSPAPTPAPSPAAIIIFAQNNALPYSESGQFVNIEGTAITIASKTLSDPTPGTFSVTDEIPATLAPGAGAKFTVTQHKKAAFGYAATFTIVYNGPHSPAVLEAEIGSGNSPLPPVGGGGGGGGSGDRPIQP
jgi:hypothetical protein